MPMLPMVLPQAYPGLFPSTSIPEGQAHQAAAAAAAAVASVMSPYNSSMLPPSILNTGLPWSVASLCQVLCEADQGLYLFNTKCCINAYGMNNGHALENCIVVGCSAKWHGWRTASCCCRVYMSAL